MLAFEPTHLHRGLNNGIGENNCFLNVTIQALWHLGPFRYELQKIINTRQNVKANNKVLNDQKNVDHHDHIADDGLLNAICNLFIQYEFTDQNVLPPTELRESLSLLSNRFQLGKIADANETLEYILEQIHSEGESSCPDQNRCLSHLVFGGVLMEQSICSKCHASSEPSLRNDLILTFQAAEILLESRGPSPCTSSANTSSEHNFKNGSIHLSGGLSSKFSDPTTFGRLLNKCMRVGMRSCPSNDDPINTGKPKIICDGKATVKFYSLEPPLALAMSVGWTDAQEDPLVLKEFYSVLSFHLKLSDIFTNDDVHNLVSGPTYAFRGLVCYYGLHYISIFMDSSTQSDGIFLLFDDQKVRRIGDWNAVKAECVKAHYQPVLLLYELEKAMPSRDDANRNQNQSLLRVHNFQQHLQSRPSNPSLNNIPTDVVPSSSGHQVDQHHQIFSNQPHHQVHAPMFNHNTSNPSAGYDNAYTRRPSFTNSNISPRADNNIPMHAHPNGPPAENNRHDVTHTYQTNNVALPSRNYHIALDVQYGSTSNQPQTASVPLQTRALPLLPSGKGMQYVAHSQGNSNQYLYHPQNPFNSIRPNEQYHQSNRPDYKTNDPYQLGHQPGYQPGHPVGHLEAAQPDEPYRRDQLHSSYGDRIRQSEEYFNEKDSDMSKDDIIRRNLQLVHSKLSNTASPHIHRTDSFKRIPASTATYSPPATEYPIHNHPGVSPSYEDTSRNGTRGSFTMQQSYVPTSAAPSTQQPLHHDPKYYLKENGSMNEMKLTSDNSGQNHTNNFRMKSGSQDIHEDWEMVDKTSPPKSSGAEYKSSPRTISGPLKSETSMDTSKSSRSGVRIDSKSARSPPTNAFHPSNGDGKGSTKSPNSEQDSQPKDNPIPSNGQHGVYLGDGNDIYNIAEWTKKSKKYSVVLKFVTLNGSKKIGIKFGQNKYGKIVIAGFIRHPQTNAILPAEECGKINIGDIVTKVQSITIDSTYSKEEITDLLREFYEDEVTFRMETFYEYMWFTCPKCKGLTSIDQNVESKLRKLVASMNTRQGEIIGLLKCDHCGAACNICSSSEAENWDVMKSITSSESSKSNRRIKK